MNKKEDFKELAWEKLGEHIKSRGVVVCREPFLTDLCDFLEEFGLVNFD